MLLTWFGASVNSPDVLDATRMELPVAAIDRRDLVLLKEWTSETLDSTGETPFPNECNFFNFTNANDDAFCDSFTIGRVQPSTIQIALDRALRCAVAARTDCVLSFEIGFGLPALFVEDHASETGMRAVLAPRLLPLASERTHVRVNVPDDSYTTKTLIFNETVLVEFMNDRKRVLTEEFSSSRAYCVQLLRAGYSDACWDKLDG